MVQFKLSVAIILVAALILPVFAVPVVPRILARAAAQITPTSTIMKKIGASQKKMDSYRVEMENAALGKTLIKEFPKTFDDPNLKSTLQKTYDVNMADGVKGYKKHEKKVQMYQDLINRKNAKAKGK